MVKSLSQLKKLLIKGTEFDVIEHCRQEVVGERRMVNYADSTGIYTIIPANPESAVTWANGGKGSFLGWSKATFWEFRTDGICALYSSNSGKTPENLIVAIKIVS